jgi:hypothetical protein
MIGRERAGGSPRPMGGQTADARTAPYPENSFDSFAMS